MSGGIRTVSADFVLGAPVWPPPALERLPQICFCGRSNVGKSSLLNAITERRQLARVSNTPGRTQELIVFKITLAGPSNERRYAHFVDLPGYGFANVPPEVKRKWKPMVDSFVQGNKLLRAAVLILDLRRELRDDDQDLIEFLEENQVAVVPVATKADKLGTSPRAAHHRALAKALELEDAADLRLVSSQTRAGVDDLRADIWHIIGKNGE